MKSPCPSLVTVRVKPVSACVAVTLRKKPPRRLRLPQFLEYSAVICCELPEVAINPPAHTQTNALNANLIEITLP